MRHVELAVMLAAVGWCGIASAQQPAQQPAQQSKAPFSLICTYTEGTTNRRFVRALIVDEAAQTVNGSKASIKDDEINFPIKEGPDKWAVVDRYSGNYTEYVGETNAMTAIGTCEKNEKKRGKRKF